MLCSETKHLEPMHLESDLGPRLLGYQLCNEQSKKEVTHCPTKRHDSEWFPFHGFCYTFERTYTRNSLAIIQKAQLERAFLYSGETCLIRSVMIKSHLIQFTHLHDQPTSIRI